MAHPDQVPDKVYVCPTGSLSGAKGSNGALYGMNANLFNAALGTVNYPTSTLMTADTTGLDAIFGPADITSATRVAISAPSPMATWNTPISCRSSRHWCAGRCRPSGWRACL